MTGPLTVFRHTLHQKFTSLQNTTVSLCNSNTKTYTSIKLVTLLLAVIIVSRVKDCKEH